LFFVPKNKEYFVVVFVKTKQNNKMQKQKLVFCFCIENKKIYQKEERMKNDQKIILSSF